MRRIWIPLLAASVLLTAGAAGTYNRLSTMATVNQTMQLPVSVASGYQASPIADQFTAPIGAAVGAKGEIYVAEAGSGPGTQPRVVRVGPGRNRKTIASDFLAPLTGITFHAGKLLVSYVGGVDVLDPATGVHHPIISQLPAHGDYPNGAVVVGPDEKLYLGIGTATNAGVVGEDNLRRGWVAKQPGFHDIPCQTITLRGSNFTIPNLLTAADSLDMATTGAFSAFGKTTARLQTLQGALPCTGAILRYNLDGSSPELVAWGLRNPAGLAFGPDGELYTTQQGMEDRGSRPVVGDRDYFYRVREGQWYGWPDFAGGRSVTMEDFQKPSFPVRPLLAEVPGQPPAPVALFPHGAGASGLLFPTQSFGLRGDALVALFGSTLSTGAEVPSAGHLVARVNPRTGRVTPFLQNTATSKSLERPIALTHGANGAVYLVDYGQTRPGPAGLEPVPGTGRLWRITPTAAP